MDIRSKLGLYKDGLQPKPAGPAQTGRDIQDMLPGRVCTNECGSFYLSEKRYPAAFRHGGRSLAEALALAPEILSILSGDGRTAPTGRLVYLDTETTGLSGGAGTVAFLVGAGRFEGGEFVLRQYLMRDYDEEAAMLHEFNGLLSGCTGLVTFNGRAFDWNLLQSRFIANRMKLALRDPVHFDLLYPSRRIWGLKLESCRLSSLEENILGERRDDDIPGAMIPGVYFKYLEDRNASQLKKVIKHNELDILSMVSLIARISEMLCNPLSRTDGGHELLGIGRIYEAREDYEQMEECLRTCSWSDIPAVRAAAAKRLAGRYKKTGRYNRALGIWREMALGAGIAGVFPYIELAMYYEHRERDFVQALEYVEKAMQITLRTGIAGNGQLSELRKRQERLKRKAAGNGLR